MYIVPFLIFLWLLSFHQGKESDRKLNDYEMLKLFQQLNLHCKEHYSTLASGNIRSLFVFRIFSFLLVPRNKKRPPKTITARFRISFSIKLLYYCGEGHWTLCLK